MTELTAGAHLYSQVCTTEVIAIRVPAEPAEVLCGGVPLAFAPAETPPSGVELDGPGTQLGKRYALESGLELLCVKPGAGTLTVDGVPVPLKSAKPLPASD